MKKQNQENKIVELYKPYVPEAVTSRILEGKDSLPSERREVTVVFVDITDFTKLADKMDPEEADNIIKKIFKPIVDIVYKYGGTINKFMGDGIMILFGASSSHEDDPERAVRASAEIQESLKRNGTIKVGKRKRILKMRIGINTGLCIAGEIGSPLRKEFTVIGDTVNLASRLQTASKPGKILISNNVFQRVKDIFIFSFARKIKVKGKKNLITVYYLKGEKKSVDFLKEKKIKYSPFVGRKRELKILEESLKNTYQSKGEIIEINGELGVGKSRLILELFKSGFTEKCNVLFANCTSWDKLKPYHPLREIFSKIFAIKDNDDFKEIERKIEDKIRKIDSSLLFASSYFLKLFTSEIKSTEEIVAQSKEEHDLFIRMIKKLLLSFSFKKTLILIVEDMQWIDEASAEFFSEFSKDIGEYPILLIYTVRESLKKKIIVSGAKRIKLLPLNNSQSEELIKSLIKQSNIYKMIKDKIIFATKRNPLFIEEVIREIKEKKLSVEKDKGELGNYRGIFAGFQIPDTVQSIARARIDLLPMGLKEILYQASAFGQFFNVGILEKVTNLGMDRVQECLKYLKEKEFIIEVKRNIESEDNFTFSHSLIQEVAYNSLLFKDRKNLHNQIGSAIEEIYSSNISGKIEELAYHFRNSNDKEKAVFYLGKAGDKAQSIYAFTSAINYFKDCIKYSDTIKVDKKKLSIFANIYNKLAFSQSIIGERKDAENNFKKALKYSKKVENKDIESLVLMNIGNFYGDMG